MDKISPDKVTVLSTTMLIPLWAKAKEYSRPDAILHDAEAVRMLDLIDYDFDKFAKAKLSQVGCCARALLLDRITQKFIQQHPDAVIIQLGAGLDARYERLGRPAVTAWYDLDLADVIDVRRQLLPEHGNIYLSMSLFDDAWIETVKIHQKPILILLEGVLMYFTPQEVQQFFYKLIQQLPTADIAFDSLPKFLVGKAKRHDALGRLNHAPPEFKWGITSPEDVQQWHTRLKLIEHFALRSVCEKRYVLPLRLLYLTKWGKKNLDMQILHYSW